MSSSADATQFFTQKSLRNAPFLLTDLITNSRHILWRDFMDLHDPFHDSYMTYPHIMPPHRPTLVHFFLEGRFLPSIEKKHNTTKVCLLLVCLFLSKNVMPFPWAKQNKISLFGWCFFLIKCPVLPEKKTSKRIHRWECFDDAIPLDLGLPVWTLTQLIHQRLEKGSLKHLFVDIHMRVYEFT